MGEQHKFGFKEHKTEVIAAGAAAAFTAIAAARALAHRHREQGIQDELSDPMPPEEAAYRAQAALLLKDDKNNDDMNRMAALFAANESFTVRDAKRLFVGDAPSRVNRQASEALIVLKRSGFIGTIDQNDKDLVLQKNQGLYDFIASQPQDYELFHSYWQEWQESLAANDNS